MGNIIIFILFPAVGCANLGPSQNTWFQRREDGSSSVGCVHDDSRVTLLCQGNEWRGTMPNCTGSEFYICGG